MQLLRKANAIFDRTLDILYFLATVILVLGASTVIIEVVTRTFWNRPIMGSVEVIGYSLVAITFFGAAWLLREGGHVRMDVVLTRLRPKTQTLLNIITSILGAIICLIVTWYGVKTAWYSFQTNYLSVLELEIPLFPIQSIIPVGGFLLFIQFLRRAYGYLKERRAS